MSNTHTAPMCPSYVGTIPYGIGYLFYKLQSDGTCIASYSILSNGEAPKTIMYIVILIAVIVIFYLIWKYLTGNIKLVL